MPMMGNMKSWPEPASFHEALPKTIKYCKTCVRETAHQIRRGPDVVAVICVSCLERALKYQLERD
jgi:hypothetical protein